ncbi:hypothetical protein LUZ60_009312 [Juncus effusus]|nr:hypothetical protein LUZ60_009312 [Juncus effusus]
MATKLEDIPSPVLISILSKLPSSGDLASCRLALSRHVSALSVSFSPHSHTRFKNRVFVLVSFLAASFRSLSLFSRSDSDEEDEDEEWFDEADDLHIASGEFISTWLPLVGARLKELFIVNYWAQSCFRKSDALHVISSLCKNLVKLEIRKAWLSVNGIRPMPNLTNLALIFVRLDDEDLNKINECFTSLQFLSLIDVGGLKNPRIRLSLETFYLEETPSLSTLVLDIKRASGSIKLGRNLTNLSTLTFQSENLLELFRVFKGTHTVKTLELDIPIGEELGLKPKIRFCDLVDSFGNLDELKLVRTARYAINADAIECECEKMVCLKRFGVQVEESDFEDFGGVFEFLKICGPSCEVTLLFYADVESETKKAVVAKYADKFPEFIWK